MKAIGQDCPKCKEAQRVIKSSLEMCPTHYKQLEEVCRGIMNPMESEHEMNMLDLSDPIETMKEREGRHGF